VECCMWMKRERVRLYMMGDGAAMAVTRWRSQFWRSKHE
jgi:hypothetical protein